MKNFWSIFHDDNTINEKAVIGFGAFIVMILFAVVDVITGLLDKPLAVNEFIFDAFKLLTIACFGIASVDKWINKSSNTKSDEPKEN